MKASLAGAGARDRGWPTAARNRIQVVAVTLVVAEEEVLAVFRTVVVPVLPCDVDGRGFGVFVIFVWDSGSVEVVEYFLSAFHGECLILYCRVEVNRFLTNYSFLSV